MPHAVNTCVYCKSWSHYVGNSQVWVTNVITSTENISKPFLQIIQTIEKEENYVIWPRKASWRISLNWLTKKGCTKPPTVKWRMKVKIEREAKKKKKSLNNMIDGNELLKTLLTRFLWCNKRNKLNTIWQWFLSFLAQGSPKIIKWFSRTRGPFVDPKNLKKG